MNRQQFVRAMITLSLSLASARNVVSAEYILDASHTSVVFAVSHLGYSYTYGRFNTVGGNFAFDASAPEQSSFVIDIDPASVDTNDEKRDEHLRSPDFLNVKQFAKMQFRSTSVRSQDGNLEVTGTFLLHGVTQEITIPVKPLGQGKGPSGHYHAGFIAQFTLKRSDFGMKSMSGPIGDEVSVIMSFEGVRQ